MKDFSYHPFNLAIRFILECIGWYAYGLLGYHLAGWGAALLLSFLSIFYWAAFAVRNDPSRSGKTLVAVSGRTRIVLELLFFLAAGWILLANHDPVFGMGFIILVFLHNLFSPVRLKWLWEQPRN
jgi:hypothetical protein